MRTSRFFFTWTSSNFLFGRRRHVPLSFHRLPLPLSWRLLRHPVRLLMLHKGAIVVVFCRLSAVPRHLGAGGDRRRRDGSSSASHGPPGCRAHTVELGLRARQWRKVCQTRHALDRTRAHAEGDWEKNRLADEDVAVGLLLLEVDAVPGLEHEELEEGTGHHLLGLTSHQLRFGVGHTHDRGE